MRWVRPAGVLLWNWVAWYPAMALEPLPWEAGWLVRAVQPDGLLCGAAGSSGAPLVGARSCALTRFSLPAGCSLELEPADAAGC